VATDDNAPYTSESIDVCVSLQGIVAK
jgi:hypothetical protein